MYVETTGNTIHIFGRNPDGSRYSKTEKYNNYLYASSPDGEYTTLFGETVTRQYYDEINRKEMRNVIEAKKLTTYEADVPLKIRYYIDKFDALPEEPLRVCMLDIEVEDRSGFPDMNVFDKPILSICCYDNFKNKMHVFYVAPNGCNNKNTRSDAINHYVFKTEETMLKTFVKFIKDMDFDLIFAWYGDKFDFPYIFGRMKICGINPEKLSPMNKCDYVNGKPVGRYWIDLLEAYKKVSTSQLESFSLDYVGKITVGRGKVEHEGRVGEMWENDIDLFLEYNINDVQLMIDIEKKRGIIKYFDTIRRVAFCSFYDVFFNSRVLDCYFLKEAQRRGIILPNKPQFTDKYEKIQGARVIVPVPGLHWYVAVGDVRSLYPTAILTGNMSPETIDDDGDIVVGDTTFKSEPRGFVPQVIQSLWDLRQEWKSEMKKYSKGSPEYEMWDNLQTVAKFLLNSIYGILLMPGSRLFDRRIGAAITYFGRETNMWMEKKLVEQGYAILGGDSITGDMKVNGRPIRDYFTHVDNITQDGKEYCFNTFKTDTVDKNGNTVLGDVIYVMRHKTNKKIYRLHFTNMTYLDVTEDHSVYGYLVNKNGTNYTEVEQMIPVKPADIGKRVKSVIVQQYVNRENIAPTNYPDEVYMLHGYFIGNGSFENGRNCINISCGNDYKEINKTIFVPLIEKGYIERVILHGTNGDVRVYGEIRNIFGDTKDIPSYIFNDTEYHIALFIKGFFSADGSASNRNNSTIVKCTQIKKNVIEDIHYLLLCCGVSSSIYRDNTLNSYKGKTSNTYNYVCNVKNTNVYADKIGFIQERKQSKIINKKYEKQLYGLNKVSRIEEIEYDDYVYDIEVSGTHKFFANNILVHNTDSMIFLVGKDDPDAARNAIEYINDTLNHFCEARFGSSKFNKMYIEFDKMYRTVLFVADESGEAVKKRYAGMIYVSDGKVLDEPYLDIKGFDSKRSDTPQFIRNEQKTVLNMILTGSGKDEVKTHIKKIRETVTSGELPPEDIAVPCGMSKMLHEYDNTSVPIHIHGARYYNNYCGGNIKKDKLKYLYVKRVPQNYPKTHVVSFVETAPEGFVWDLERMAVRLVDDKFKNILYSLGWGDQTTLEAFLG